MFFSVDVESSTTKQIPGGLLSIGAVAITQDTLVVVDKFYCNVAYDPQVFDEETIKWWDDQDEDVRMEAFDWSRNRLHPLSAATNFAAWVESCKPEGENAYFVANPVAFDQAWINMLFNVWDIESPFHYRSLCLRSMLFGITGGTFGESRGDLAEGFSSLKTVEPVRPHHALFDAEAQGQDLINMLQYLHQRNTL